MRNGELVGTLLIMNPSVYKPRIAYFRPGDTVITDPTKFLDRDLLNAPSTCRIIDAVRIAMEQKYTTLQTLISSLSADIETSISSITTDITNIKSDSTRQSADILKNKNDITNINSQLSSIQTSLTSINNSIVSLNTIAQNQQNDINSLTTNYNQLLEQVLELQHTTYPLSISLNGGGIYEYGTSPTVTLNWSVTRNGVQVTPTIQKINNVDAISPATYHPTSDITYNLSVTYDGQNANSSAYVKFVHPSYCGIVVNDFVLNSTNILSLNKTIKDSKGFDVTYSELVNQKVCYAYPKQYGDISSIRDSNGFEYINSYILSTVTIDTIDYNVYLLESPTSITNFKQTYS